MERIKEEGSKRRVCNKFQSYMHTLTEVEVADTIVNHAVVERFYHTGFLGVRFSSFSIFYLICN